MAKSKKKFVPAVTVVVPTYNVENYIAECLQSLLDQTLENVEVIVVDDCSTDNSVAIVKNFLPKFDGRLNLITLKKNCGCAAIPRNTALNSARGDYVYFLDGDDFIDKTALEDFYNIAEEFDADVVHAEKYFEYKETPEGYKDFLTSFQQGGFVDKPTLETSNIGQRVMDYTQKKYLWWGCNKLFRRKLLVDNKIKFPQMTSFEDYALVFCCLINAKNYVRVPFISYHYRIRYGSLSHKPRSGQEIIRNMAKAVSIMDRAMLENKFFIENPQFRYTMINYFVQWRMDIVTNRLFFESGLKVEEIYAMLYNEVFSEKSSENSALTAYLFIATSIFRINLNQQANQIADLKNQLAKFQNQS